MDTMSHPDVRGKGLFVRSSQAFFDFFCQKGGAELLYGFPGAFHFNLGGYFLNSKYNVEEFWFILRLFQ